MELKRTKFTTTIARTKVIDVDLADMPENAIEKMVAYGVQRIFNDAIGGVEKFPTIEEKIAHVEEMLVRFKAGDIGRQAASGVDALTREMRKLARTVAKSKLAKDVYTDRFGSDVPAGDVADRLDAIVAKAPDAFKVEAEKELARKADAAKSVAGIDINFGDTDGE